MPEPATYISALRTGKVDFVGSSHDSRITSIDQVESLARTNPEIVLWNDLVLGRIILIAFSLNKEPFDDLRVRQAMNMALDHETINATYYQGLWKLGTSGAPVE